MKDKTGAAIIIHDLDAPMLGNTPPAMLRMFGATQSPPADSTVKDGDLITVGDVSLRVIHTPGHTPGGMVLYTEGFVFTGDTLFVEAVGRTDLPGGSWPVMHRSIKERIFTLRTRRRCCRVITMVACPFPPSDMKKSITPTYSSNINKAVAWHRRHKGGLRWQIQA